MRNCLTAREIEAYLAGDQLECVDHLEQCHECQQALQQARENHALIADIRRARSVESSDSRALPHIPDYQVIREIGRGGMGVVYEAIQESLGRTVALKVLPGVANALKPDSAARFRIEAEAAASLHHPNIVPIFDYGESTNCQYYAMELIRGLPLNAIASYLATAPNLDSAPSTELDSAPLSARDLMKRLGVTSLTEYYHRIPVWFAGVAQALQFAHERSVVHRDIKPSNLILCPSGRLLISDFGLAKNLKDSSMTQSGQLMGTISYMSPEQIDSAHGSLDHRTDVYGLGVTLYEMLALTPAYGGKEEAKILKSRLEQDPPHPRSQQPQVPKPLEIICLKAMQRNVDSRYETAAALAGDLLSFSEGQPISARPPGMIQAGTRILKRYRLSGVLLLIIGLLVTSVVSLSLYYDGIRRQSELKREIVADLITSAKGHLSRGDYNIAVQVYSNALQYDRSIPYVYSARARAYASAGQLDQALEDMSQAITLNDTSSLSFLRRGIINLAADDLDAAQRDLQRAVRLNPNDASANALLWLASNRTSNPPPWLPISRATEPPGIDEQAIPGITNSMHRLTTQLIAAELQFQEDNPQARQLFERCLSSPVATAEHQLMARIRIGQLNAP